MIIVANFSYWCYINRRKIVSLIESNFSIQIEYGDIFEILGGKKVIPFDECFTTKVGSMPSEIKQDSVCGQYLSKHPITDDEIQMLIGKMEVKPAETPSKFGGQTRFESGTLLPREDYLLMAFVKLDQNGLGHLTYEEYLDSLDMLWEQIDRHYGTSDVYVPILGSRITRFDQELTQQQLLDIMISSYRLSPKKIKTPCKLHIVCRGRDGFSLNNVFGIN